MPTSLREQTDRQAGRFTDGGTDRLTGKQRQTDARKDTHRHKYTNISDNAHGCRPIAATRALLLDMAYKLRHAISARKLS